VEAVHIGRLATVKAARGWLLPDPVMDHRIGWNPGVGMLYAEGHPGGERLACPDELPAVLSKLTDAMHDADIPAPGGAAGFRHGGFAGVRRLDSTVDLRFDSSAEGIATLAGVAGLLRGSPRLKLDTIYAQDGKALETVYLRGRQYQARWYDKGVESRSAERGTWIRPEDQRRYMKATRRDVTELHTEYVRSKFRQRFSTLWKASEGVTVAGIEVLARRLQEHVAAGRITELQAERLAGHLLLQRVDLSPSRATSYRRRSDLQELGLVLADGVLQEVEIHLQDVLEEVMETPAWGAQG